MNFDFKMVLAWAARIFWAAVVGAIVYVIVWLLGSLLIIIPIAFIITVGKILIAAAWIFGALAGLLYLLNGAVNKV